MKVIIDKAKAPEHTTNLEQLLTYSLAITATLSQGVYDGGAILQKHKDLVEERHDANEWKVRLDQLSSLKQRWDELSSPLHDLKTGMEAENLETAPEALSRLLQEMKLKKIFRGGDSNEYFAVTAETRENTRVLDAITHDAAYPSQFSTSALQLRVMMRLFYNCCWEAVKEAEFWIRKQNRSLQSAVFIGHEALGQDGPSWFDLDTTGHITGQDCELYASCFDE
ncbi:hypothetical protein QFC24_006359 [Naganishia onofrii]|uniref:Uncharacterized protein n=1 Tax=Naganishia onofrii TaxID=1851511 RepID=A0ACC2X2G8_9TREE|nr:hypothetical protein QFC24_006359 [Naganishia onofrii]